MQPSPAHIKGLLADKGLKATSQRIAIAQELFRRADHPTADMVYEAISGENPAISLGTVYKTLESFVKAELATKVHTGDGLFRFDGKTDHHNHLYATNTNQIFDYEDNELNELLSSYFLKKQIPGFDIHSIQVHITGEQTAPIINHPHSH